MSRLSSKYPRRFGDYLLLEHLGAGGMSEVDLAKKLDPAGEFAQWRVIKRIKADRSEDAASVRMFKDEGRITAELHHENIARTYEFGKQDDDYFLVMEYIEGVDLRHVVNTLRDRNQRLPLRVALYVMSHVLKGLDYAHSRTDRNGKPLRIIHRDINPRNVMVSVRGDVKVIDFGVAKAEDRLEKTRTDHIKGKFQYMSPEQIQGLEIDHRADLYALGLTLHELVTGFNPFHGLSQIQVMHRLLSGKPPDLPPQDPVFDAGLRRIHDKALHSDVNARYPDAGAFRKDIEALAAEIGGMPAPERISQFLERVEPGLRERIDRKLAEYVRVTPGGANPTDEQPAGTSLKPAIERSSGSASVTIPLAEGTGDMSFGSLAPGSLPAIDARDQVQRQGVARTGAMAVGGAVVVGVVLMLVVLASLTGTALGVAWVQGESQVRVVEPAPKPLPSGLPVAPVPISPSPTVEPEPEPPPAPRPRPAPVQPAPAPEPVEVAPVDVPAPAVKPAPVVSADPAWLQVACGAKKLAVRVDSENRGETPVKVSTFAGTHRVVIGSEAEQTVVVEAGKVLKVRCKGSK